MLKSIIFMCLLMSQNFGWNDGVRITAINTTITIPASSPNPPPPSSPPPPHPTPTPPPLPALTINCTPLGTRGIKYVTSFKMTTYFRHTSVANRSTPEEHVAALLTPSSNQPGPAPNRGFYAEDSGELNEKKKKNSGEDLTNCSGVCSRVVRKDGAVSLEDPQGSFLSVKVRVDGCWGQGTRVFKCYMEYQDLEDTARLGVDSVDVPDVEPVGPLTMTTQPGASPKGGAGVTVSVASHLKLTCRGWVLTQPDGVDIAWQWAAVDSGPDTPPPAPETLTFTHFVPQYQWDQAPVTRVIRDDSAAESSRRGAGSSCVRYLLQSTVVRVVTETDRFRTYRCLPLVPGLRQPLVRLAASVLVKTRLPTIAMKIRPSSVELAGNEVVLPNIPLQIQCQEIHRPMEPPLHVRIRLFHEDKVITSVCGDTKQQQQQQQQQCQQGTPTSDTANYNNKMTPTQSSPKPKPGTKTKTKQQPSKRATPTEDKRKASGHSSDRHRNQRHHRAAKKTIREDTQSTEDEPSTTDDLVAAKVELRDNPYSRTRTRSPGSSADDDDEEDSLPIMSGVDDPLAPEVTWEPDIRYNADVTSPHMLHVCLTTYTLTCHSRGRYRCVFDYLMEVRGAPAIVLTQETQVFLPVQVNPQKPVMTVSNELLRYPLGTRLTVQCSAFIGGPQLSAGWVWHVCRYRNCSAANSTCLTNSCRKWTQYTRQSVAEFSNSTCQYQQSSGLLYTFSDDGFDVVEIRCAVTRFGVSYWPAARNFSVAKSRSHLSVHAWKFVSAAHRVQNPLTDILLPIILTLSFLMALYLVVTFSRQRYQRMQRRLRAQTRKTTSRTRHFRKRLRGLPRKAAQSENAWASWKNSALIFCRAVLTVLENMTEEDLEDKERKQNQVRSAPAGGESPRRSFFRPRSSSLPSFRPGHLFPRPRKQPRRRAKSVSTLTAGSADLGQ